MPARAFILSLVQSLALFFLSFYSYIPTTLIYSLSLHDALPILCCLFIVFFLIFIILFVRLLLVIIDDGFSFFRSEEHTSELQARGHPVCRRLREIKNKAVWTRTDCSVTRLMIYCPYVVEQHRTQ